MHTSFNLPDYDEHRWPFGKVAFPFNIDSIKSKSPTLPLHFDRSYLPKNLCETELLNVSQCLLQQNYLETKKSEMCGFQLSHFEICRRHRDLRILSGIRAWETQHVKKLDSKNRDFYQMGMGRKLDRLQQELEMQPSTVKGIERAQQLHAEIRELKYRLDYIKEALSEQ